jgi:TonB-linked SusC/RagA family outer membrane protein
MKSLLKVFLLIVLLITATSAVFGQITITGKVIDNDLKPVTGANITVKGTTIGVITDVNGKFTIKVPSTESILTVSFIGFVTREIVVGKGTVIDVTLETVAMSLDEVVVVGYGTQKKVNLTGAVDVVSGDVLQNRASASIGSLLQGQSPNLNISVTNFGGEPGSGTNFNIRGMGTLSGPSAPLILVDGFEMDINLLDPETVQNVSVLKDAASAAIYGSRAPFGVVLITTKKGAKNKGVSVTYSNNISFASPISLPAWQSSIRYVTAYNEALENSGQPDKFLQPQIGRINAYIAGTYLPEYDTINPPHSIWAGRHEGNANYDWWDMYFKDVTVNQKHNINISGGDEKTQYFVSAGMYDQGTSYNWADEFYRRYNVSANITTQATNWLRLSLNSKYTSTQSSHPNLGTDWDPDRTFIISEMIKFFPTTPLKNWDGTICNPYANALMKAGAATLDGNDLFTTLGGEIEPIKGWKTNFNYNFNYNGSKNTYYENKIFVEIPDGQVVNFWADPDIYTENWGSNKYNALNAFTSYERTVEDHFFKAMVGYEQEYRYFSNIVGGRSALISDQVLSFSTATGTFTLDDAKSHWATQGFFGRLNYNYKEKYLFEVNARYNGSSRFGEDSRWGLFPSVSMGYNISKEAFWESLQYYVNNFKIRGSYGSLGNQNVGNYLYLSSIPINTNLEWIMDGARPNYSGVPDIISPTLTWETINTLNIGADASFLNNRLGLVFDWYTRKTLNMFGPAMILPSGLGANPPQENNASIETKGWEISLTWTDRTNFDLGYSLRFSLADARTHVTDYLNTTGQIDEYYKGREIGEIWGYTTDKIMQNESDVTSMADQTFFYNNWGPGDIRYADLNDDGKIDDGTRTLENHGDLSIIGNASPRFSMGLSASVTWKNFDFSLFGQGVLKRDLMPYSNMWWGVGTQGNNGGAFYQGHDDYWRPSDETNLLGPNTDAYYAKPYVSSETYKNQQTQTHYLLNMGYFRLKNVQVGYTIPQKITSKLRIQRLNIYVSGENLFTMTHKEVPEYIDPETSFSVSGMLGAIYPLSRSYSVGINVTF